MTHQTTDHEPKRFQSGCWVIRGTWHNGYVWQVLDGRLIKSGFRSLREAIADANRRGARFPASIANLTDEEPQHHEPGSKTVRRSRKPRQAKR